MKLKFQLSLIFSLAFSMLAISCGYGSISSPKLNNYEQKLQRHYELRKKLEIPPENEQLKINNFTDNFVTNEIAKFEADTPKSIFKKDTTRAKFINSIDYPRIVVQNSSKKELMELVEKFIKLDLQAEISNLDAKNNLIRTSYKKRNAIVPKKIQSPITAALNVWRAEIADGARDAFDFFILDNNKSGVENLIIRINHRQIYTYRNQFNTAWRVLPEDAYMQFYITLKLATFLGAGNLQTAQTPVFEILNDDMDELDHYLIKAEPSIALSYVLNILQRLEVNIIKIDSKKKQVTFETKLTVTGMFDKIFNRLPKKETHKIAIQFIRQEIPNNKNSEEYFKGKYQTRIKLNLASNITSRKLSKDESNMILKKLGFVIIEQEVLKKVFVDYNIEQQ